MLKKLKSMLRRLRFFRRGYLRAVLFRDMRKAGACWSDLALIAAPSEPKPQPETFMFSRYGTETVGNHFILLGLMRALFEAAPAQPVYLLSSNIAATESGLSGMLQLLRRTAEPSPLSRFIAQNVFVTGEEKIRSLAPGDLLILGGGPIMDDPAIAKWLLWFRWARRIGARTAILGCGIGPLRYRRTVTLAESLLALTDAAVIRNQPKQNFPSAAGTRLRIALDPAFLCLPFLAPLVGEKKHLLAVNARMVGFDCAPNRVVSADEVVELVTDHALFAAQRMQLEQVVPFSTQESPAAPDSIFANRVAAALAERLHLSVRPLPETSVIGLVDALLPAEYALSLRMHGFILALMLGCRAANLDYILEGGKGSDLYRDWLGRTAAPSLFIPGSLGHEDFVSLADLSNLRSAIDTLLVVYVDVLRRTLDA